MCAEGAAILASPYPKVEWKQHEPLSPENHFVMLPCLFQTVLDSEDRKLQRNVRQELSSNCFNYGAYHTLEAVSISEQVKIRSLAFRVL